MVHLRVVADAAEEVVGDARRPPAAAGDLERARVVDGDVEFRGGAADDLGERLRVVVGEAVDEAEARAQGSRDESNARRRADEREARQVEADGTRVRPLVEHDVDGVVLHRAVEVFLDGLRHAVDLVDENDVAGLQRGQQPREVAGLRDDGPRSRLDVDAHGLAEDVGERRLAEAGRA